MLRTLRSTTTMFALLAASGTIAAAQGVASQSPGDTAPRVTAEASAPVAPAGVAPRAPAIDNADPVLSIPALPPALAPVVNANDAKPVPATPGAGATSPAIAPAGAAPPSAAPSFALDMGAALARVGDAEKSDADVLTAFYGERNGAPVWVDAKGRTPAATAMIAFMGKAEQWGLDPASYSVPPATGSDAASREQLAADEAAISIAALKYARHAKGGRTDPLAITKYLDRKPPTIDARAVMARLAAASDPAAVLRDQHPKHAAFQKLREMLVAMLGGDGETAQVTIPDGPTLRPGEKHAQVALVRTRLGVALPEGADATVYDKDLVEAVRKLQTEKGLNADGIIGRGTRNAMNGGPKPSPRKLLANLEQWRWMPEDLGSLYVWVNVPEYTLRVVSNGEVIHTERVIVGKTNTQTPIFSHAMEQVIFHPFWGVPDSIKQNEILPSLQRGGGMLAKNGLRIQAGGRDIDPYSVDWTKADIRRYHVYQPPGASNVLGVVKFRFPNHHAVYMHDTPSKGLFQSTVRTFSHGCMRVRNPLRLAEILLAADKGMTPDQVQALAQPGATPNNQVNLTQKIPVHITYFTASVDAEGELQGFNDIYAHDERITLALAGKMHLIQPVPEPKGPARAEPIASFSENFGFFSIFGGGGGGGGGGGSRPNWAPSAFGGN
ncbi:MAG: L,D-transpeptidase family protein [Hyphomicrobiaceae bacterium]